LPIAFISELPPMTVNLDLDSRAGWPEDLRLYLERYPRPVWPGHANLGEMARFWLQIHDGFRRLGGALAARTRDFQERQVSPEEFQTWLAPRLQTLLSHLHGHHQIEDYQFFPLFSAAEPRLVRGFEVLEHDHEQIHETIVALVDSASTLLRAEPPDLDLIRRAGDAYAKNSDALLRRLDRHLADEEDLIIPLILDRSEAALGI
jgi:hemerythrin HHE cation binding domain-containing protein